MAERQRLPEENMYQGYLHKRISELGALDINPSTMQTGMESVWDEEKKLIEIALKMSVRYGALKRVVDDLHRRRENQRFPSSTFTDNYEDPLDKDPVINKLHWLCDSSLDTDSSFFRELAGLVYARTRELGRERSLPEGFYLHILENSKESIKLWLRLNSEKVGILEESLGRKSREKREKMFLERLGIGYSG